MSVVSRVRSAVSRMSGRSALTAPVTAVVAASLLLGGSVAWSRTDAQTVAPHDSSTANGLHEHNPALPAAAMEPAPAPLLRAGWTVSASDEEISGENGRGRQRP